MRLTGKHSTVRRFAQYPGWLYKTWAFSGTVLALLWSWPVPSCWQHCGPHTVRTADALSGSDALMAPAHQTLLSVFQGRADDPALLSSKQGSSLSHSALKQLVLRTAGSLRASGISHGDVVTIADANTVSRPAIITRIVMTAAISAFLDSFTPAQQRVDPAVRVISYSAHVQAGC